MAQKPFVLPSGVDFYAGDGTAAGAADPLLVVSDSTNKVGINSQTPSGTLDINTASATDKGLIVRGATSQSTNLFEAQNASSGILYVVDSAGKVGIITQTPTGTLDITAATASTKGIILRAKTSQSVNLLEYTDPTGAIYGYVNSFGELNPAGSLIGKTAMLCIGNLAARLVSSSGDPWGSDYSTFIGSQAGYNANNASFGIYIGDSAGKNSIGYYSTFIGAGAGQSATPGAKSSATLIGANAGYTAGTAYSMTNATMIGSLAGNAVNSNSDGALFIGTNAGASSSGSNNMYIGYGAGNGYKGTTNIKIITPGTNQDVGVGNYNNIIGGNIQGDRNVVIGYYAGGNASFGSGNVIIGTQAGAMLNGGATYNLLLGDGVSSAYDGGVGYIVGSGLKGSYNIDIAPQNAYSNITNGNAGSAENQANYLLSYKLNIARTIRGDISTKQVSIGNASLAPTATLDVISNSASRKGVIIQGAASQSANYLEIQNSSSTILSSIDSLGQISGVALNIASGITIPSGIPAVTTSKLYASGTALYWNGSSVSGAAGSNTQVLYNNNGTPAGSAGLTWDNSSSTLNATLLKSTQSITNEGGQIDLSLPSVGSSLSGTVAIDIYQNRLRIFETTGSNRGVYIDLTAASGGVGSNLLAGGGGGTTTNALTFTSGIAFTSSTFNGSTAVTIGLPATTVYTSGSYANPAWITSIDSTILSGAVPINKGGTALSSTPSNGQLLVGNGANYTLATLTAGSGMNVTNGAGSITINSSGITANTLTFASGLTSTVSTFNGSAAVTIGLPSTTVFGAGTSGWVPYYNSTSGIAISSGQSVYLGTVTSPFATAKTLIVKAAASQSVNIFEVQNSSGSGLFTIDQSGGVNFAPWSGTSTSPVKYDGANNRLVFTGSGTAASGINLNVLNDSTLSFESTAGQLFSISDGLASGTIFSVNDISGMSSIEVDASGLIKLGEYDGFIGIGTSQLFSQYSGKMEINAPSGYKGIIVRGSTGGTGNLFEAQNASSGTLWVVDASGRVNIGGAGSTNQLEVDTLSATTKGLVIKSFASQTANLFEVQNSSAVPILSISSSGAISGAITPTIITSTGGLTLTDIYNGYIIEQTGVAASGTFTIGTVTIPGWNCMIVNIGSGVIVSSGSNTMRSPGGLNKSRTQYSAISIYRRGSSDFVLTGDLA